MKRKVIWKKFCKYLVVYVFSKLELQLQPHAHPSVFYRTENSLSMYIYPVSKTGNGAYFLALNVGAGQTDTIVNPEMIEMS